MTLVDTSVLLDIVTRDPAWMAWSLTQLDAAALRGPLVINPVIYAEYSIGFTEIEHAEQTLTSVDMRVIEIPREALFLAGKAFVRYRREGGARTGVLPDLFIGAHAAVAGLPLLTRDPRRVRHHFPGLEVVAPA